MCCVPTRVGSRLSINFASPGIQDSNNLAAERSPGNLDVPHRAVALEDTLDLDIYSPIREDWLKRQDDNLRRG